MKCPKCNTEDFFQGLFGGNCINKNCSNYKGGTASSDKPKQHDLEVLGPYWICFDCIMYIANGELPDDIQQAEKIVASAASEESYFWVPGGECEAGHTPWAERLAASADCEWNSCDTREFSSSFCDCCHSSLGGSRHKASLIKREE